MVEILGYSVRGRNEHGSRLGVSHRAVGLPLQFVLGAEYAAVRKRYLDRLTGMPDAENEEDIK